MRLARAVSAAEGRECDKVRAIQALFEVPVWAGIADLDTGAAPEGSDEWPEIARAVPKRRREFAAGRAAARSALKRMGCPPALIPRRTNGTPEWPSGVIGSISHCAELCGAVVAAAAAARGIGLDVELGGTLSPGLLPMVATSDEICRYAEMPSIDGTDWGKLIFSAKEAFYKSVYPVRGEFMEFADVTLFASIDAKRTRGEFYVRANTARPVARLDARAVKGRWEIRDNLLLCGATYEADCGPS